MIMGRFGQIAPNMTHDHEGPPRAARCHATQGAPTPPIPLRSTDQPTSGRVIPNRNFRHVSRFWILMGRLNYLRYESRRRSAMASSGTTLARGASAPRELLFPSV